MPDALKLTGAGTSLHRLAYRPGDVAACLGPDGRISYASPGVVRNGCAPAGLPGRIEDRGAPGPQVVLAPAGPPSGSPGAVPEAGVAPTDSDLAYERHELFEAVFEYSSIGKLVATPQGRILRVNETLLAQLGYQASDMVGKHGSEFGHPDEIGRFDEPYRALLAGDIDRYRIERRFRHRNGDYIWCSVVMSTAHGADGQPRYVLASLENLTASRAKEAELRRQAWALGAYARSTAALLHGGDVATITASVCDAIAADNTYALAAVRLAEAPPSKAVRLAAAAGQALGYLDGLNLNWDENSLSGRGPVGRSIRSREILVTADCDSDPVFAPWRDRARAFGIRSAVAVPFYADDMVLGVLMVYAARPNAFEAFELDLFRKLADELAFAIMLERQKSEQEAARQAVVAAEDRLRTLEVQLAHLGRLAAMNEMGAALAHELNQPLAAATAFVQGASRLLAVTPIDVDLVREGLRSASEELLRAGGIIRRLREFVAKGTTLKRPEPLSQLVEEAVALSMVADRGLGVRLRYDFASPDVWVMVDRVQVQQVIVNLTRNAAEAMSQGDRRDLTVTTQTVADGMAQVSVCDTGPGLDPEVAAEVFQPFRTTKTGGMGVGLSISRGLVEAQGGRLWWEPNPEGGAIFRFTVPVVTSRAPA